MAKFKSAVITHRCLLPAGLGDFELVHQIDRAAIKEDYEQFVKENPDFSDTDTDCDDVLLTYFTEQALSYGDQLRLDHFKRGLVINCAKLDEFKGYLFQQWLKSEAQYFNSHIIYDEACNE